MLRLILNYLFLYHIYMYLQYKCIVDINIFYKYFLKFNKRNTFELQ